MNKPIFIIVGAVIIFILIIFWIYLLLTDSTKDNTEIWGRLGLGESVEVTDNTPEDETVTETAIRPKLKQLTTRMIAGWEEIADLPTSDLPTIYYTEMGTGHVYSLNLESGEETRVSGTTVVGTTQSDISPAGDWVAFGTLDSNTKNITLRIGEISTSSELIPQEISSTVDQFEISADGKELFYSTKGSSGMIGYSYNFSSGKTKEIFNLPIHEAVIQWGTSTTHYFNPKTTYLLEGHLSEVNNAKITRLPADGFGFSALANSKIIAYTKIVNTEVESYIFNRETNTTHKFPLAISFLPEKCLIADTTTNLICAYDTKTQVNTDFPDNWYQGTLNLNDSIWLISGSDMTATLLVDIMSESGRAVDVENITIGDSDRVVYFTNKNDNTLWMYEL